MSFQISLTAKDTKNGLECRFVVPVRLQVKMTPIRQKIKKTFEAMKSEKISFWIAGQPSRTTHQSGTRISGRRTYKTKPLIEWEAKLAQSMKDYVPKEPLKGAIKLTTTWEFQAKSKAACGWKTTRPDTDNLQKTLKDVMTRIGFWEDDSQVVYETAKKKWTANPGIAVSIERLGDDAWNLE